MKKKLRVGPNLVVIRTYCEAGCDCPNCHSGKSNSEDNNPVESCVYCQLKWANCGEYDPEHSVYKRNPPKGVYYCECGNLIKNL